MIEHQFAAMPARKSGGEARKAGQQQAVGQDLLGVIEAKTCIGAGDGDEHHAGRGVVPTRDADANAGHCEQFECANDSGENAEGECGARGPDADLHPERVGGPPIENIDAERGDHEGDGEMHEHGVDGMTGNGNGRANVLFGDFANGGIGVIGVRLKTLFQFNLDFLGFFGFVAHWLAPRVKFVALGATPLVLAGCTGELSTLDPAGPRAQNLATLWWVMFAGSMVLFALVMGLLALTYVRPAWITRLSARQWIIGGGLVMPIPVLVLLTGTALVFGEQLLPKGDVPVRIEAHAQRWSWTFTNPDGTVAEDETLHMPAGEPVDIVVTAEDVIHSFWVPRLGGKIDAIPGHENVIRLEADQPGIYWGICAEYCGSGHETMLFRVEAHSAEDYALMTGPTP